MKNHAVRISAVLSFALLSTGCTEASGPGATSHPEDMPVIMGNFHINTGPVVTNADGQSKDIVDDYVLPAQLPNVNFEVFTTHLYAPTSGDVSTTVSGVSVRVRRADGTRTNNIFQSVEYVGKSTVSGRQYDVFRLNGFYNGQPPITKANFANVTFDFNLEYEDSDGDVIASRSVTLSVYQRI